MPGGINGPLSSRAHVSGVGGEESEKQPGAGAGTTSLGRRQITALCPGHLSFPPSVSPPLR